MQPRIKGSTAMLVCRDDWRTSDVTRQVAVLAALGIPILTNRTWLDIEGREQMVYVHGLNSEHPHRSGLAAKVMVQLYRRGELQATDPLHPFLDGLRAIHNLQCLQDWIAGGGQCRCSAIPTAPGRAMLTPGLPWPLPVPLVATRSPARAAALALLGHGITRIEHQSTGEIYHLTNESLFGMPGQILPDPPPATAAQLIQEQKENKLPPEHPFLFAYDAIRAYRQLIRHCYEEPVQLMLRAKGSTRSAFVLDCATSKAKRDAERFVAGLE